MRRTPDLSKTTPLVARALGTTPAQLLDSFRPARASDLPRVVALRQSELGAQRGCDDATYLTWRYRFGNAAAGRGECWLLERGEEILAIIGTEDVDLNGARGPCRAVFLMDILVRNDVRGIAIGPWINLLMLAKYECVGVYGSNHNSRSMVSSQFAEQRTLHTYSFYLRCNQVLRRRLDLPLVTTLLASVGNLVLRAWRAIHLHRDPAVRVSSVRDIEELEPAASWRHDAGDVGRERYGAFLDWRVMRNPRGGFGITAAWRGERLAAYLVVRQATAPDEGQEVRFVDWFSDPDDDGSALRTLIIAAIETAAASGHNVATVSLLHERSEAMFGELGFLLRPDPKTFVYTCREPHPMASGPPFNWYITTLDGDVD